MSITEKGLILKVINSKESDRSLVILTEHGLVSAYAKSARNIKNKKFAATSQFCYTDFVFFEGKDMYIVDEAAGIEVFFELRSDIERLALAQYFCELLIAVTPESSDSEDFLRLSLNALKFLCDSTKNIDLIKSVFELKLMCFAGFMPDLTACSVCGTYTDHEMLFNIEESILYCSHCENDAPYGSVKLNQSMLAIMRHIVFSDFNKIFNFTASCENLAAVSKLCEKYVEVKAERHFKTLDFYYSVKV